MPESPSFVALIACENGDYLQEWVCPGVRKHPGRDHEPGLEAVVAARYHGRPI